MLLYTLDRKSPQFVFYVIEYKQGNGTPDIYNTRGITIAWPAFKEDI